MTSQSNVLKMPPSDRAKYGGARIKNAAFDAVYSLWRRRSAEGWTQVRIAEAIGVDAGWLSRNLRGPANWTLETFGALVEALEGEAEIVVHGLEDTLTDRSNYDAYSEFDSSVLTRKRSVHEAAADLTQNISRPLKAFIEATSVQQPGLRVGLTPEVLGKPTMTLTKDPRSWS